MPTALSGARTGSSGANASKSMPSDAAADVDGFNLARTVVPECLEDFAAMVVPVLRERGAMPDDAGGTYRARLFGAGDHLAAPHPAAAHRWWAGN